MSSNQEICFGLYLGNTTCSVAINKKGNVEVPANADGFRVTPSIVALHDGAEIVSGQAAKQGIVRYSRHTIMGVLRHICNAEDSDEPAPCSTCPPTINAAGQISYIFETESSKKTLNVNEVLEKIFGQMMNIASYHASDVFPACLCLPSWATEKAVRLCVEAAHAVGFNVLSVVFPSSAATIAYDLLQPANDLLVLHLHLGASSGTASLLEVSGGVATVRDSAPLNPPPGDTITGVLAEHIARMFQNKHKVNILEMKRSKLKLFAQAEKGKHLLSLSEDVSIQCESLWEGVDFTTSLSRMRFDSMIGDTIQGIIQQTEAMLAKLDVKPEDVHKVVVSGGCCAVRRLHRLLADTFPSSTVLSNQAPDQVLAIGAAKEAGTFLTVQALDQATTNGVANGVDESAESKENANKGSKSKKKKNKKGQDPNAPAANGVAPAATNGSTPASKKSKKKKAAVVEIKTIAHQASLVSVISVPIWCLAGGSSVLLLPRLSPPLVRHTATLPPLPTNDHSLCVYEGKEAEKEPTKVLAKITMPKDCGQLSVMCMLRTDGRVALLLTDMDTKRSKQVVIGHLDESPISSDS